MWKKKIKFGYIKGKYTNDGFIDEVKYYIFEVMIVNETDDYFEIKYGDNMITGGMPSHLISGLEKVVQKDRVKGVHEKTLNWFKRIANYKTFC